jgi:hypothetical protein
VTLKRVLPVARVLRERRVTLDVLSIEDLAHAFVLRIGIAGAVPALDLQACARIAIRARDQRQRCYLGQVVGATRTAGRVELALSFAPPLDPHVTMLDLEIAAGGMGWRLGVPVVPTLQPATPRSAGLDPTTRQVLELAERVAELMHQAVGPEHLLLAIAFCAGDDAAGRVLGAVNLDPATLQCAIAGLEPSYPADTSIEHLKAALNAAARRADAQVEPDHLLLGLLAQPGTRVDHVLASLGLPRQLLYELVEAQHSAHAAGARPGSGLRRVVGVGQALRQGPSVLTVMSLEDYATGFLVRARFESPAREDRTASESVAPAVSDDRGRTYPAECRGVPGWADENGSDLDLTWRSSTPLPGDVSAVRLDVPWLGRGLEIPLAGGVSARAL